jgi:hypothetical protein
MPKARKMVSLNIQETSGVDHPAHLQEGWLVIKSSDSDVSDLLSDLAKNDNDSSDRLIQDGTEEEPMAQDESTIDTSVEETEVVEKDALADANAKIKELEMKLGETMKKLEDTKKMYDEDKKKMMGEEDKKKMKFGEDEDKMKKSEAEELIKSAPEAVQIIIAEMRKSADEALARANAAEEVLLKEREVHADAEAIAKAKAWSHLPIEAEKIGPALRKLAGIDTDLAKAVEDMLNAVEAQAESANIFAEIGKSGTPTSGSAYEQLSSMAKAVSETSGITFEQAFTKAVSQDPALYSQYLNEKGVK